MNGRNWLFVGDHVAALQRILEASRPGQTYNIAGRTETVNLELVRQLCAILDRLAPKSDGTAHADATRFVTDRPGHDRRYALSGDKMERELGWSPTVPLQDGLETTVAWYLDNSKWWREILRSTYALERLGLAATEQQSHA